MNDQYKPVYLKAKVKVFFVGDEPTRSYWKAKRAFNHGEDVSCYIHVAEHGDWRTSNFEFMSFGVLETKRHQYIIKGKTRAKRILWAKFLTKESALSSRKKKDLIKVKKLIEEGEEIVAEVMLRSGNSYVTTRLISISNKSFITATYSVYRWW